MKVDFFRMMVLSFLLCFFPGCFDGGSPGDTSADPAYLSGHWIPTGGPPGGLGYDIRMDPRNPDIMYVTDAWAGVFKSTDGGENWFPINNGITSHVGASGDGVPIFSLTIDPNNPDTLWAGTQFSGAAFRSDDGGMHWISCSNGIEEQSLTIRGFTVEPGNSDVVYLAGEISSWEWNDEVALPGLGLDMTRGAVYKTVDGGDTWNRIWYGDNLARYIWIHPDDHNLIYVSTGIFDREAANSDPVALDPGGVGILRSRDGGVTWEVLDERNGFRENELYFGSLFMHPDDPDTLIAAAGNDPYLTALGGQLGAVYMTHDGGDTWERVLELNNASVVEICTGDPEVMYAGSRRGIYRSSDGGQTWDEVSGDSWGTDEVLAGFPIDMQCDPRDSMRIFINNYIGGNFLSEDGGETWSLASRGYTGALLRQVTVAADDPARVYSASRMGIFTSANGGTDWHGTSFAPARQPEGYVVAVDPFDSDHIMEVLLDAGPNPAVSMDCGQSWAFVDTGLWPSGAPEGVLVTRIVFSAATPGLVLATAGMPDCYQTPETCIGNDGYGIIRSMDGGQTWAQTSLTAGQVFDLKVVDETTAYAAVYPNTIYCSEDSGSTWEIVAQDIVPTGIEPGTDPDVVNTPILISLAVDPADPNLILAGYANGGLMRSADRGQSWQVVAAGMTPELSVVDIEADRAHPGVFYLGSLNGGVYYSVDAGTTWNVLNEELSSRDVTDLALSSDGSVLYAATSGAGVCRLGAVPE